MNKHKALSILSKTGEAILVDDMQTATLLWQTIYPEYSLFKQEKWYEDEGIELLYAIVSSMLLHRNLSDTPYTLDDLKGAISSVKI